MRKAIKASFELCKLQVCYFHFCKAIWNKIKKLHLFKKAYRVNTMLIAFIIKAYPFIKRDLREEYCKKIECFCNSLKGNYIKFNKYFLKYWKKAEFLISPN